MLELLQAEWFAIATAVIAFASALAKITPNETDNKIVGYALKFIDVFALTTGKTEIK